MHVRPKYGGSNVVEAMISKEQWCAVINLAPSSPLWLSRNWREVLIFFLYLLSHSSGVAMKMLIRGEENAGLTGKDS